MPDPKLISRTAIDLFVQLGISAEEVSDDMVEAYAEFEQGHTERGMAKLRQAIKSSRQHREILNTLTTPGAYKTVLAQLGIHSRRLTDGKKS